MKRARIAAAAFALLTVMSSHAQEMNEDAPAVNASTPEDAEEEFPSLLP